MPRQAEAVVGVDARGGAVGLAARVLDRLRLVEDQRGEARDCQQRLVAHEQRVGGQRDVAAAGVCAHWKRRPAPRTQLHAQVRREPLQLAPPVADQAGRRHDQRRRVEAPRLLLGDEVGDRLQRLAEPHVVGEHAARAVRAQVLQPAQPVLLIRAQRGAQTAGHRRPRPARRPAPARDPRARSRPSSPARGGRRTTVGFGEGGVELAERAGARRREAHLRRRPRRTARRAPSSGCGAAPAGR